MEHANNIVNSSQIVFSYDDDLWIYDLEKK